MARPFGLLLVLAWTLQAIAHYHDPRIKAFNIPLDSKGEKTYTVAVSAGNAKATCTFTYSSIPPGQVPKKKKVAATEAPRPDLQMKQSLQDVLAQLRDKCVTKRIDYWDYEICIENGIKQFHLPDSYNLGSFVRWDGDSQIYDNGAMCEARTDNAPRKVKVSFACSGKTPTYLADIKEMAVCEYDALIGTPLVCEFPRFPVLSAPPPSSQFGYSPQPEVPISDGSQDWVLQLSELADGRFMCSAYTTESKVAEAKLFLQKFAIHAEVQNLPLPRSTPRKAVEMFVARQPGRTAVKGNELLVEYGKNKRSSTLASSDNFNGKLAYVKVFA